MVAKGVDENGGLTSLPPETDMMGLNDRTDLTLFKECGSG